MEQARKERVAWFEQARFGMFIHWGLYSILGRNEWVRNVERIPNRDYDYLMEEFRAEAYDPNEWARLAKKAGMKYAILTAKHHDGFCLFDSKLTTYTSMQAACQRDLVRDFLDAFRAQGIRVGLYYSLLDWHHPDYPHYHDPYHPMRQHEAYKDYRHNFDNYLAYMHGQVEELVTNYGKIDIMWFDFSYEGKQGQDWKAEELMAMVRRHQPHIICDNRLEGSGEASGSIKTLNPTSYAGDFVSPEQMIPPEGLVDQAGQALPWESCITLNHHWGYTAEDNNYKSAQLVVRSLVECVSKGGNLLVNVGPDARGQIPDRSVQILSQVGKWMAKNGPSIYGCGPASIPKPEWGRLTQRGNDLYAHILEDQVGAICLQGLRQDLVSMRRLADGSDLGPSNHWNLKEYSQHVFFHLYPSTACSYPLPDPMDTVIQIRLKAEGQEG